MKKAIILIICILYGTTVVAQQSRLSDIVNFSLPGNPKKLSKEKLRSIRGKTKESQINPEGKGDFYEIDDMLIRINASSGNYERDHLEKLEKGLIEMFSFGGTVDPYFKTEIKNINGNKVLITSNKENYEKSVYSFFSVNNTHTKGMVGLIEFNTVEKSKATDVLDKILNSVKFKSEE